MADLSGHPAVRTRRIAILHYTAPPVVGGVERVLGEHAGLLADAGHQVRVVAGRGTSRDPRVAFVGVPRADSRHPEVAALQAELDAGRVPASYDALVAALADDLSSALGDAEVVIAHNVASLNLNLALTAALHVLASRPGAPRLVLWHHDLAWTLPAYRTTLHPGRPWDLLRSAWPGAAQVTISEARRRDLAALMGLPLRAIRVVPNGVDVPALLGLADATVSLARGVGLMKLDPLLLLPVRVTPRKNIAMALRVLAAMHAGGRVNAGLVVTGPVDPHAGVAEGYLAALVDMRAALGLEGRAIFLAELVEEPIGETVVQDLYRLSDLLFLVSVDEGFGIPILEAAVHRLPIVCSDLPALRDLAGDAAVYVRPDADPASVAAACLSRLDRDALATFARRVRTEYSWDAVYWRWIAPLL